MGLCDGVVTTNSYLATAAEALLEKPASIIPNYLNREQMEVSAAIWDAKEKTNWERDDRIHIGYFSGTPTHNRDFGLVARALARVMDDDKRVILRVVGFLDNFDPELDRHRGRIETIPLQDFVNLQREIGRVEINLVPLQDNIFTNCKSELKWFEAAIVGAVTIASPTHTYRGAIRHGQNGWLAPAYAWKEILREVIDGGLTLWRAVAKRAREDAIARYGWRNQAETIRTALFDQSHTQRQGRTPLPGRIIDPANNVPAEHTKFEEQAYLDANPDVAKAVAEGRLTSGRSHYETWGRNECRPLRSRSDEVLKHVSRGMIGIEVGAYFNPLAAKAAGYNCLTMDVFSADQLRHIAEGDKNIPKELISNIEAVDILGSANEIGDIVAARYGCQSFDYIISSHNFEHLPNPIRFLQGCDRILKVDGYLSMALPDLRCCFDYFRWPTTLTEWLESFFQNRDRPAMSQVFTHIALHSRARINDIERYSFALATPRELIEPESTLLEAYQGWCAHNKSPDDVYHDVHCSAFTPASFQLLIFELNFLGLTELQCVEVCGPSGNEFYVHLRRKRKRESLGRNEYDKFTKEFYLQRTALMRQVIAEKAQKGA